MGNKSWIYVNQWMSGALFSRRKAHVLLWPPCRGRRAPSDGIDETGAPLKIYLFAKRNRPFIDHLWTMVMFRSYIKISKGDNHPRVTTTLETLSLKQLSYSKLWRRDPIFSCVSASICGWAQSGFCLVLIHPTLRRAEIWAPKVGLPKLGEILWHEETNPPDFSGCSIHVVNLPPVVIHIFRWDFPCKPSMGVSIVMGLPKNGWFISWKIPEKSMIWRYYSPISGSVQMAVSWNRGTHSHQPF